MQHCFNKMVVAGVIALNILFISSCRKSESSYLSPAGSWTFKSIAYQPDLCSNIVNGLPLNPAGTLVAQAPDTAGQWICFWGQTLPTRSVIDTVLPEVAGNNTLPPGNYVFLTVFVGRVIYTSNAITGSETIQVTVTNGKVNVYSPGLEMVNPDNPSDTGMLSFNLHQN